MADPQGFAAAPPPSDYKEPTKSDEPYSPTPEEQKQIEEVETKFRAWRDERRPNEVQWFVNAAFYRGQQYVAWDNQNFTLRSTEPPVAPHKKRIPINRIFPKIRARISKFVRARPKPEVLPASNERTDRLNARGTQLALDYTWRKQSQERKYRDALLWAATSGKGFWWLNWNDHAKGNVKLDNPLTGNSQVLRLEIGDVDIEVGSPFEVLVSNPGVGAIGDQPEIMRVKLREVEDVQQRYPDHSAFIKATPGYEETFQYEKRIAALTARAEGMTDAEPKTGTDKDGKNGNLCLVMELFCRPSGKWPDGRYLVVAGGVLVKSEPLPWFGDMENPYPVIEFSDVPSVGQFWSTTVIEQLIGPQRQYNFIRNKIDQQLRLMMHPKVFVPKQAMMPKNAFHSGAGEKIEYNWIPGLPAPFAWTPPNVASDAWRMIQTLKEEIEDISQIFPAAEGAVGDAKSGFQTNLLQEASDSVHAPDARAHELAIEDASWKIRRLMKLYYDVPRLLTISGRHRRAEVLEFHQDQIDENADIIVQTGSGLPTLKAARQQIISDWYDKGVFGKIGEPETNRRFLAMAEVPGMDELSDTARKDEDLAQMENDEIAGGGDIPVPQFYEDHNLHYTIHSDELKSAEARDWPDEQKLALIRHLILHMKYINAGAAFQLAMDYGFTDMIGQGVAMIPQPMPPMLGPPGGPEGAPEGGSSEGPPPSQEPPPQAAPSQAPVAA